jgi:hypothetical protein
MDTLVHLKKLDSTCAICLSIISIPARLIQTDAQMARQPCKCLKRYCVQCVRSYILEFKKGEPKICPTCRAPILGYKKDLRFMGYLGVNGSKEERIIDCYYPDQCNWTGTREEFEYKHFAECKFIKIPCKHKSKGCKQYDHRHVIQEHEKCCPHTHSKEIKKPVIRGGFFKKPQVS